MRDLPVDTFALSFAIFPLIFEETGFIGLLELFDALLAFSAFWFLTQSRLRRGLGVCWEVCFAI